eukprot:12620783-Prorocentrum_lima.AAC.1
MDEIGRLGTACWSSRTGSSGTWVEEVLHRGQSWGLGCTLCRWAGINGEFGRGVSGWDNRLPFNFTITVRGEKRVKAWRTCFSRSVVTAPQHEAKCCGSCAVTGTIGR